MSPYFILVRLPWSKATLRAGLFYSRSMLLGLIFQPQAFLLHSPQTVLSGLWPVMTTEPALPSTYSHWSATSDDKQSRKARSFSPLINGLMEASKPSQAKYPSFDSNPASQDRTFPWKLWEYYLPSCSTSPLYSREVCGHLSYTKIALLRQDRMRSPRCVNVLLQNQLCAPAFPKLFGLFFLLLPLFVLDRQSHHQ